VAPLRVGGELAVAIDCQSLPFHSQVCSAPLNGPVAITIRWRSSS
jgi:hypothetical protein